MRDRDGVIPVAREADKRRSGWPTAQASQDKADRNGYDAQSNPDSLQRAKSAPPPGADEIHCDDTKDDQQAEHDHEDTELALGYHCGPIIARRVYRATLSEAVRSER